MQRCTGIYKDFKRIGNECIKNLKSIIFSAFQDVLYSILIGKITIGIPNLKNRFCMEKIVWL
jgi:hypothetical protein